MGHGHGESVSVQIIAFYRLAPHSDEPTLTDELSKALQRAQSYGIGGFCLSWSDADRAQVEKFVSLMPADAPFCLGARRGTVPGEEIGALKALMTRPNYIRVGGRPLFLIGQVDLSADAWRSRLDNNAFLVLGIQAGDADPVDQGFDRGFEMPINHPLVKAASEGQDVAYAGLSKMATEAQCPSQTVFETVLPATDMFQGAEDASSPALFQI
ncbi:MAG: hypothetical protein ABUL49_00795, partial [bacterium]